MFLEVDEQQKVPCEQDIKNYHHFFFTVIKIKQKEKSRKKRFLGIFI